MKPLARTTRRRMFWSLVGVFIIGTPLLIGYSQGYRLDDALLLIQTGGIYIHSDLENTRVYLNGEYFDSTGIILRNKYIQELSPNKWYEVWMEKDGYQSWVKRLPVYPNLVTEAHVLMIPELFEWVEVASSTTIIITEAASTTASTSTFEKPSTSTTTVANPEFEDLRITFENDKDQFAVDVATSTYVTIKGIRMATTTTILEYQFPTWITALASSTELESYIQVRERDGVLAWLDGGDLYATWVLPNERQPSYFCTATCTPLIVVDWGEPITRYEFFPNRSDVVVIATSRGVYAVELDARSQRNIQLFTEIPGLDFRILSDGTLVVFDDVVFRKTTW